MSKQRTAGLLKASKKEKKEAMLKTEKAIAKLTEKQEKITIRSVAREAGVSVSYIYKYPELAYKIQTLRDRQKYSLIKSDKGSLRRNSSLDTLYKKNSQLKEGLSDLKEDLGELKLYLNQLKPKQKSPSNLREENNQLKQENAQLREELKYTRKKLKEARDFILNQVHEKSLSATKNKNEKDIIPKVRKIKQV